MSWERLDYSIIAVFILSGMYLLGPNLRRVVRRRHDVASSIGGGIALAYVFLQLFPEIEEAHAGLGDRIHLVTLASLIAFDAIELRLLSAPPASAAPRSPHARLRVFWLHIALSWIYTALIVFVIPGEAREDALLVTVGSVAIGLHLIYKDYVLRTRHPEEYELKGRYLLALAPVVGWLAHFVVQPPEHFFDFFVAILAGFLMQNVFREELPKHEGLRLGWLVIGAAGYALLVVLVE